MAGAALPPGTQSQPLLIFRSLPWSFHYPDPQDQVTFPQVPSLLSHSPYPDTSACVRNWWWRTGRPGVLQSMASPRVGYDWATEWQRRETKERIDGTVKVVPQPPEVEHNSPPVVRAAHTTSFQRVQGGGEESAPSASQWRSRMSSTSACDQGPQPRWWVMLMTLTVHMMQLKWGFTAVAFLSKTQNHSLIMRISDKSQWKDSPQNI